MFLKKFNSDKIIVSIFLVSIFVFASVLNAGPLRYGDYVHIQNGFNGWNGGYLDTCGGSSCGYSKYSVTTAPTPQRAPGTGTWKIISANGKPEGSYVMACDDIHLQNQYGEVSYLGVCGVASNCGCILNKYCVSTSLIIYSHGSTTWKIIPESTSLNNCEIMEEQVVRLLNGYSDFQGGFLDTCEVASLCGCSQNLLCVSTTQGWNKNNVLTTSWRLKHIE